MNLSRINFSCLSLKKVSDLLVFHQLIIQDSRLLLNEKEINQGKKTIDIRYRNGENAFFFHCFVCEFLMNPSHSSTLSDLILSDLIFRSIISSITRLQISEPIPRFLFVSHWLVLKFRKNTEIAKEGERVHE